MITLIFSPRWFYGIDAIFESFAILATAFLAFYSYKFYRFGRQINYKHFSFSFLMLSLAFLAKVVTNLLLYFPNSAEKVMGFLIPSYPIIGQASLIYGLGHLTFRFFTLLGLLGIFWIIGKYHEKHKLFILIYFASVVSLLSIFTSTSIVALGIVIHLYIFFHLTAAIFLAYISYFYFRGYRNKKKKDTMLVAVSFSLLLLSQLVFLFVPLTLSAYVLAEFLQLAGYLLLLYEYYILVKGK